MPEMSSKFVPKHKGDKNPNPKLLKFVRHVTDRIPGKIKMTTDAPEYWGLACIFEDEMDAVTREASLDLLLDMLPGNFFRVREHHSYQQLHQWNEKKHYTPDGKSFDELLDKLSYLPIYIRLDHNQGHIGYDSQIINAVNDALNAIDAELEKSIGSEEIHSELDELWLYFHSHQFWTKDNHKITPIIFIDQFEEIFTKNDNPDDIWSFFNVIDSLQYSTPTERLLHVIENNDQYVQFHEEQNFRMVFTMREDFLARLEDYSYNIPALRKNRIGLKPLNGNQALEVILKPRPDMVTRDVALHII